MLKFLVGSHRSGTSTPRGSRASEEWAYVRIHERQESGWKSPDSNTPHRGRGTTEGMNSARTRQTWVDGGYLSLRPCSVRYIISVCMFCHRLRAALGRIGTLNLGFFAYFPVYSPPLPHSFEPSSLLHFCVPPNRTYSASPLVFFV